MFLAKDLGNHPDNVQLLSEILGKKTLIETDPRTKQKSQREVAVMDPDQLRRYLDPNSGNLIVTRASGRALRLKSEPYFKALPVWVLEGALRWTREFSRRHGSGARSPC